MGRYLRIAALLVAGLLAVGAGGEEGADTAGPVADAPAGDTGQTDSQAGEEGGYAFPPEVEELLNNASDPEGYAQTERCIFTREIRDTDILDQRHLVFELTGKRLYLVQFQFTCPGLRRGASIVYETRNSQLCRLDQIRAFEPGPAIPNPPCTIPGFMPVEKEQVALLKESLKSKRKAELDAYKAEKAEKKARKQAETESEPVSG
ncbi:MAG: DUF6491 family protein [Pseudomonadales bacterium]